MAWMHKAKDLKILYLFLDKYGLLHRPLYAPEDDPDIVNAKFDTGIDRMIWGIGQYSAMFNGASAIFFYLI